MLSDFYPHGQVAQSYGILRPEGYAERAIFVIDKRGVVRYVDVHPIDDQPDNEVLFAELYKLEPGAAALAKEAEAVWESQVASQPQADVVMYCTPWCPACRRARAFFKEHGIQHVEVDISKDRAAARQVREWAGGPETTPTFNVRGTVIINYDEARLSKALGIK